MCSGLKWTRTHRAPIAPLKAASKGTVFVAMPGPDALPDEPCDAFALEPWRLFSAMRRVGAPGRCDSHLQARNTRNERRQVVLIEIRYPPQDMEADWGN